MARSVLLCLAAVVVAGAVVINVATSTRAEAPPSSVLGEYLEARTCDVWTGPCFANGEINLTGDHATLGWSVERGVWLGVQLDGLHAAAAVDSIGTLGSDTEGAVKAVVFIDRRANAKQSQALLALVRELGGKYLENVVRVERGEIRFRRGDLKESSLEVDGGKTLRIATRALHPHCDAHCGNEELAYRALARTTEAAAAKTAANLYSGDALGPTWSKPGNRGAILGRFGI